MKQFIRDFTHIDSEDLVLVGGKGANLGEMSRAGMPIPPGFCVTVAGFDAFIQQTDQADTYFQALANLTTDDLDEIRRVSGAFREHLLAVPIPDEVAQEVIDTWRTLGEGYGYAVRSSATAEDLPSASFAGQQDTFLNVRGEQELLESVRKCWTSLFTDRAVLYRIQNEFDHRQVQLSVVVQRMVASEVSGTLFTADPVSGHRQMISIDASFGLGEALVAGLVTPDNYKIDKRGWRLIDKQISEKKVAICPKPDGGVTREELGEDKRNAQALNNDQIIQLAHFAEEIERHYGAPQDIEWGIEGGKIFILQSRPITTLFPVPEPETHPGERIYISFGHPQVMTSPISPMGISLVQVLLAFGRDDKRELLNPYVLAAGGRIYVDGSPLVYTRIGKKVLPRFMTAADELMGLAFSEYVKRDEYERLRHAITDKVSLRSARKMLFPLVAQAMKRLWVIPTENSRQELDEFIQQALQKAERITQEGTLEERITGIYVMLAYFFRKEALFIMPYIMVGMMSKVLLERMLSDKADPADLAAVQSGMAGNVTTQMDLVVGDLADTARAQPAVVNAFDTAAPEDLLATLEQMEEAGDFLRALDRFLKKYGVRGFGEIDIARDRWQDDPTTLLQMVRGNLKSGDKGTHRTHFAKMAQEADAAAERLAALARRQRGGRLKTVLVKRWIKVLRAYMPTREHPKFLLVKIFKMARDLLMQAGEVFTADGRLEKPTDIWYLTFPEVLDALKGAEFPLAQIITERKTAYEHFQKMTPPRVITSEGEIIKGRYATERLPDGAIPGSAVSAGVVEGLAKVVMDPAKETVSPGEILVAPFTDPAWTPLFINAAGLVLDVGGLMTHGSVVAREYGIPAVVGVVDATTIIKTGMHLRVNGDMGFVEIID